MVYVIINNIHIKKMTLERFSDEKWTEASKKINPSRILYVTKDIQDEKLNSYGMTEIIWTRYYSQMNKSYDKISIPFIPDNYGKMEEMGNKKLETKIKEDEEKYQKVLFERDKKWKEKKESSEYKIALENKINMIKENNKYITDGADEMQVLSEWKMSNFIMPPPTRVTEIKNTYEKLSWTQFIELVKKLCNKNRRN